ncbi:MAG TPA: YbaK/EbsC family protein [Candidatus Dormibacteraeota bacterium]|nr:YbaK/EbsC family protein [Candidatus Dormibacteraeota bacterium]
MKKAKAAAIDFLEAKQIPFELLPHKKVFTATDEAATLHVDSTEVIKTVVLDVGTGHVIAVIPASRRLDMGLVRQEVADKHAHLAGEIETERDFPAYELGSIPPIPSMAKVPVFVDPEIMHHEAVIFAADHEESLKVKTFDLFSGEYVTVAPLCRHFAEMPAK